jgi:hypothetical protein
VIVLDVVALNETNTIDEKRDLVNTLYCGSDIALNLEILRLLIDKVYYHHFFQQT